MNGTVAPPSSSSTAAVTCRSRTLSSVAMRWWIDVVTILTRLLVEVRAALCTVSAEPCLAEEQLDNDVGIGQAGGQPVRDEPGAYGPHVALQERASLWVGDDVDQLRQVDQHQRLAVDQQVVGGQVAVGVTAPGQE